MGKPQIVKRILGVIAKPFLTNLCKIVDFKGIRLKQAELSQVLLAQDRSIQQNWDSLVVRTRYSLYELHEIKHSLCVVFILQKNAK